jgi:positive regulator of sigma E activity
MNEAPPLAAADPDDPSGRVDRISGSIYGTIIAASVMATGAGHTPLGGICLAVVVTLLVYWLAEAYAHVLALRIVHASQSRRDHVHRHLRQTATLVTASVAPLAALLVAALLGADTSGAVLTALIFTAAWLGVLGWIAARRAGLRGPPLVASTVGSGLIGLVLIALKFALH